MSDFLKNIKFNFSGNLAQFNISLLIFLAFTLFVFNLIIKSHNVHIQNFGSLFCGGVILLLLIGAIVFHSKRHHRSTENTPSLIKIQKKDGTQVEIKNPPDKVFLEEHRNKFLRTCLLGYDENLSADGEVIGDVANKNFRVYSEKEKAEFKRKHRKSILGKQEIIKKLIEEKKRNEPKQF